MAFEEICERTCRATVGIVIEGDAESPFYIASGVLIQLAGVEFVLTAAHNVWDSKRGVGREVVAIAVMQVPPGLAMQSSLGETAGPIRVHPHQPNEDPDPDVAAVELVATTHLLPERKPFTEDEIRFCPHDQPPGAFILCGFPSQRTEQRTDLVIDGVPRKQLDMKRFAFVVASLPGHRFREEPAEGRGLHVFLDPGFPPSPGMSGGPLVIPDRAGMLVGLARARCAHADGHDQWCEPVVEAVRPLAYHGNADVAAAARRIVARCDARPVPASR